MIYLFLLFYSFRYFAQDSINMIIFSDFGFIDGGSFEVSFQNSSSNNFFIAFLNARERIYFNNMNRYLAFTICQKPRAMYAQINYSIEIKNGGGTLKGNIPTKGVYYPFFLSCIEASPRFEVSIKNTDFRNNWDFWVYPETTLADQGKILITNKLELLI